MEHSTLVTAHTKRVALTIANTEFKGHRLVQDEKTSCLLGTCLCVKAAVEEETGGKLRGDNPCPSQIFDSAKFKSCQTENRKSLVGNIFFVYSLGFSLTQHCTLTVTLQF